MPGSDETPEPAWPSDDHDDGNDGNGDRGGDGGRGRHDSDRVTNQLPVPNVTQAEEPTVWVRKPEQPPARPSGPQPPRPAGPSGPPGPARPPQPPQQRPPHQPRPPQPQPQQQQPQSQQQRHQQPPQRQAPPHQAQQQPAVVVHAQQQPGPPPAATQARPMRIEPDGRQHPAPASTGSDAPAPPETTPEAGPAPKRKRRGLLLTGLALLLVIAAGVVLALPDVSNRLALPWAPNAPQGDPPEPVAVTTELSGPPESAPTPTPAGVAAALDGPASDPALGTLAGSVVDPATGTTLWARDENTPLTPASTTKLLVAGAALLRLDHGMQLSTRVVEGSEPGSVVLVAGGDVTLNSLPEGEESIYQGAAHLDDLVEQVKQATGGNVTSVQLDLSAFAGDTTAPGWAPGDAPSTFAAPVVPAMLDGGRGDPKDEHSMRVANPAGTLAQEFAQRLGAQVASEATTTAPRNARVLGEVRSAPLTELVDQMLQSSDNLLGDVLARIVATAEGREPSFAGGAQAVLDVLARNGFDVSSVRLSDGSGLSTRNKVPAAMLSDLLASAAAPGDSDPNAAKLRPMLGGLPVAGGSGTLATRYTEGPATEGRGWVRAKTGTLSGVNTLAGVVLDADGRVLVFTLMSSGADIQSARAALDDVAAQLRGCGCR